MNFTDAIRTGFKETFNFRGRALRSEYWWWALFEMLIFVAGMELDALLFGTAPEEYGVFGVIVTIITLLPTLAVKVRRLHDVGRSGYWLILMMAVYIMLVFFTIQLENSYHVTEAMLALTMVFSLAAIVLGITLLVWMVKPGSPLDNEYGPPRLSPPITPKAPDGQGGIDA